MRSRSSRHIHSRFRRSPAQAPCVVPGPLDPAREHRCTHQRRLWMVATALPCHSPPSFHLSYPRPPLQDLNSTDLEFDRPLPYKLAIYLCIILFLIIVIPSVAFAPLNLRAFAHRPTSRRPKRPFLTTAAPSFASQSTCRSLPHRPSKRPTHFYPCAAARLLSAFLAPKPYHSNQSITRLDPRDSSRPESPTASRIASRLLPHSGPTSNPQAATPAIGSLPVVAQHGPHQVTRGFYLLAPSSRTH